MLFSLLSEMKIKIFQVKNLADAAQARGRRRLQRKELGGEERLGRQHEEQGEREGRGVGEAGSRRAPGKGLAVFLLLGPGKHQVFFLIL